MVTQKAHQDSLIILIDTGVCWAIARRCKIPLTQKSAKDAAHTLGLGSRDGPFDFAQGRLLSVPTQSVVKRYKDFPADDLRAFPRLAA